MAFSGELEPHAPKQTELRRSSPPRCAVPRRARDRRSPGSRQIPPTSGLTRPFAGGSNRGCSGPLRFRLFLAPVRPPVVGRSSLAALRFRRVVRFARSRSRAKSSDSVETFATKPSCPVCPARTRCPILANAVALRGAGAQTRLADVLALVHFAGERLPFRRVQAGIALACTGGLKCEDVQGVLSRSEVSALDRLRYREMGRSVVEGLWHHPSRPDLRDSVRERVLSWGDRHPLVRVVSPLLSPAEMEKGARPGRLARPPALRHGPRSPSPRRAGPRSRPAPGAAGTRRSGE